jgi:hypothetical protein
MERWVCPLTIVGNTGNVTQLYPEWAEPGANPATATVAQQVRYPCEGKLISLQCLTNGADSFEIEIYDISGMELGIDVSSANVITDAELTAAIAAKKAKRIFKQNVAGNGLTPFTPLGPAGFMKGLAARAVGTSGACALNMDIEGGYRYLGGFF